CAMSLFMTNQPAATARRAPPTYAFDAGPVAFFRNIPEDSGIRRRSSRNLLFGRKDRPVGANILEFLFFGDGDPWAVAREFPYTHCEIREASLALASPPQNARQ